MKRVIQLGIVWLTVITLGGCGMIGNTKQESNGALSAEHEALCNSKNTLNKTLCRETMGQLPKFTSEINTYFKEKFNIDGFKLTGISFPYGKVQHGGFNATFQLERDPYVMITDTFDYSSDKKYTLRPVTNEDSSVAGQSMLASAILAAEYFRTLPIEKISKDLEELGIRTDKNRVLFFGYGGRYFERKNLTDFSQYEISQIVDGDKKIIINNYLNTGGNKEYQLKYDENIKDKYLLQPISYVDGKEQALLLYKKYIEYIDSNNDYKSILRQQILVYNKNELSYEKYVDNREGEVTLNG